MSRNIWYVINANSGKRGININKYKAINTPLGELYGRDCIYLNNVNYNYKQRVLILKGFINNYVSDKTLLDAKFSKYILTFTDVLALKVLELDSWEEIMDYDDYMNVESSFDEVLNSSWIKKLGGKVTSNYHHYLIQTYDDVFEVVCLNYQFQLIKK